jgi:hypothetical protein
VPFSARNVKYAAVFIGGTQRDFNDDGILVLHPSDLSKTGAAALRKAIDLAEKKGYGAASEPILVSSVPADYFVNHYAPVELYHFSFLGQDLRLSIHFESNLKDEEDKTFL